MKTLPKRVFIRSSGEELMNFPERVYWVQGVISSRSRGEEYLLSRHPGGQIVRVCHAVPIGVRVKISGEFLRAGE